MNHFSYLFFLLSNSEGKAGSSEGTGRRRSHHLPPTPLRTDWNPQDRGRETFPGSPPHTQPRGAPTAGESPPGPPGDPSVRAERKMHQESQEEGEEGWQQQGCRNRRSVGRVLNSRRWGEVRWGREGRARTDQCATEDVQGAFGPLGTGRKDDILCRPRCRGKSSFPSFSLWFIFCFCFLPLIAFCFLSFLVQLPTPIIRNQCRWSICQEK